MMLALNGPNSSRLCARHVLRRTAPAIIAESRASRSSVPQASLRVFGPMVYVSYFCDSKMPDAPSSGYNGLSLDLDFRLAQCMWEASRSALQVTGGARPGRSLSVIQRNPNPIFWPAAETLVPFEHQFRMHGPIYPTEADMTSFCRSFAAVSHALEARVVTSRKWTTGTKPSFSSDWHPLKLCRKEEPGYQLDTFHTSRPRRDDRP